MTAYVALLRAVNVGGTGLLPMKDLAALCEQAGFKQVKTYIQSGNVVFASDLKEVAVRAKLEDALTKRMKKPVDVIVRTAKEMRAVVKDNPFVEREPAKTAALFLHGKPPVELLKAVIAPGGELVKAGKRELYVYYPEGMGRSKLKLPLKEPATARNINTTSKLASMSEQLSV